MNHIKHRLRKNERLASRKQIDKLFVSGRSIASGCMQMIYLIEPTATSFAQILFSVPKKQFSKAVDRNLIKRRMRESYRLEKHILSDTLHKVNVQVTMAIIFKSQEFKDYTEMKGNIKVLLNKIILKILIFKNI